MAMDERIPQQSAALVRRAPDVPAFGDDVRLQLLWLALQQRSWRSLAVMAAGEGIETLSVADTLAKVAWAYTGQPTCVFDMRDLNLRLLEHQIRDMAAQLQGGERVFVALRSMGENPTAVPLAMAADAVVLCVELGRTDIKSAQRTLAAIGREKFLGTLLVPPPAKSQERAVVVTPPPPPDVRSR
jgi:hypothetical protein